MDLSALLSAGTLGQGLYGLFGGGKKNNPADAASPYLNQIPGAMGQYYNPYIQQGQQVNPMLQQGFSDLFTNPGAFYDRIGSGYKESPGYQFKLQQALAAGNNANAAGGMLGTNQHAQQNMGIANGIASQDYNDYIGQVMKLLGMGSEGLTGLSNQGYNASTDYAGALGSNLGSQAQNAYSGQQGRNQQSQANWGNVFGGLAGVLGSLI